MEPANRSLDLRYVVLRRSLFHCRSSLRRPARPAARSTSSTAPPPKGLTTVLLFPHCHVALTAFALAPHPSGPSLTTEYTPRERSGLVKPQAAQPPATSTPTSWPVSTPSTTATPAAAASPVSDTKTKADDGVDPSALPPVAAPPSAPVIDPTATGMLEGRPIFEVDIAALAEKAWRRAGSDISDWFNYGFDEISWEAYCYRRRELGDLAAVLKTNVVVRARVFSFFLPAYLVLFVARECRTFPACLRISSHSFLRSFVQWS